jgi:dienelactone hydrolase
MFMLALLPLTQTPSDVSLFPKSSPHLAVSQMISIGPVGKSGRIPFVTDAIQARIVKGEWEAPTEGQSITLPDGSRKTWKKAVADKDGWFSGPDFEGGYAACRIDADSDRIVLLEAAGDSMVYVNGVPRVGDPYAYGWVRLPISLHRGSNSLLFLTGRGRMKVQLEAPPSALILSRDDMTLPDAVAGINNRAQKGALVVINASAKPARDLLLTCNVAHSQQLATRVREIPPLGIAKVPFGIPPINSPKQGDIPLELTLASSGVTVSGASTTIRVRSPQQNRKETYVSDADGSVQYYCVVPPPHPRPGMAMILSLHGASVEATSQADAYSPKNWAWIVCATNRRPFGFDWEDLGRTDGMDVLRLAINKFRTDPTQTYVTGHSMGGHGTWQFGALFPDRFAAIGVSAGWASFFSYVGVPRAEHPSPMIDIFQRANGTSNTADFIRNYATEGVYILHGDADDNVPVTEARAMRNQLATFHKDLGYHEQPGAGHWWDGPAAPGADCLEWPEMIQFMRSHRLRVPKAVDFTTSDLLVNSDDWGVKILGQIHPLSPSRIRLAPSNGMYRVVTSNISRLAIPARWNDRLVLDGQRVTHNSSGIYQLVARRWQPGGRSQIDQTGPFKSVLANRIVLIYGTSGTREENTQSFNKARYDAESLWYRGNGSLEYIADREALRRNLDGRNIVIYGNADTNSAWKKFLSDCPIQAGRGWVRAGAKILRRPDIAATVVWRQRGTRVAAIAGSGTEGFRLTERLPYFVSGVGFPDWMLETDATLRKGMAGVLGAGYFSPTGDLQTGDHVWQTAAP